jgi:murein tripeptide amidase MpaA
LQNQLYYVYWLVENYNTDPIARYILNNREIYWIPIFNPDGYYYNEVNTSANWRKNRKPCSGGTGTDLNRNFGIYQFWNAPNGGRALLGSETWRGILPFSEPETQVVANLMSRNVVPVRCSAHGNLLIKLGRCTRRHTRRL